MAAPITIKKKKRPATPPPAAEDAEPVETTMETTPESPVSTGPTFVAPTRVEAEPSSYLFAGICAILATVLFGVVILLQVIEYTDLGTAIPRPIPTRQIIAD